MLDSVEFMNRDKLDPLMVEGRLALGRMVKAVGNPIRWRVLQELERGPKLNVELCERMGVSPSALSRHLGVLKIAGMVMVNRAGLYSIPPHFVAEPGVLDYGHMVLRVGK